MAQAHHVGCNDAVLVISLLYLSIDIQYDWDTFSACYKPIHKWLLVSYTLIVASRLVHIVGSLTSSAESGDFLLNLRQKHAVVRFLTSFTWFIIVPAFTFWSAIGTKWILEVRELLNLRQKDAVVRFLTSFTWFIIVPAFTFWSAIGTKWILEVREHTPHCLPSGVHLWFLVIWQVLGYLWVLIHCGLGAMAWFLEHRLRNAELDLEQIEDADVVTRWGQVSRLSGYTAVQGLSKEGGLAPSKILALPSAEMPDHPGMVEEECPICLNVLKCGDTVRQLGPCGHTFHRSCIDLWLLRRADCPLCKHKVKGYDPIRGWEV
eukprot:CAMPEP_0172928394 /NCGR_PEP_ID=MMETSP1075-20121228/217955_1 /TAXON_ID=2916 /ORGANISM="Ceratium fusus, Strain PA161109" /LENGTH=318 /DNA_ID=CAMNT_0013789681 /DNA_START=149 /DNA_END=1105 /DNA_ORIENTATION=+